MTFKDIVKSLIGNVVELSTAVSDGSMTPTDLQNSPAVTALNVLAGTLAGLDVNPPDYWHRTNIEAPDEFDNAIASFRDIPEEERRPILINLFSTIGRIAQQTQTPLNYLTTEAVRSRMREELYRSSNSLFKDLVLQRTKAASINFFNDADTLLTPTRAGALALQKSIEKFNHFNRTPNTAEAARLAFNPANIVLQGVIGDVVGKLYQNTARKLVDDELAALNAAPPSNRHDRVVRANIPNRVFHSMPSQRDFITTVAPLGLKYPAGVKLITTDNGQLYLPVDAFTPIVRPDLDPYIHMAFIPKDLNWDWKEDPAYPFGGRWETFTDDEIQERHPGASLNQLKIIFPHSFRPTARAPELLTSTKIRDLRSSLASISSKVVRTTSLGDEMLYSKTAPPIIRPEFSKFASTLYGNAVASMVYNRHGLFDRNISVSAGDIPLSSDMKATTNPATDEGRAALINGPGAPPFLQDPDEEDPIINRARTILDEMFESDEDNFNHLINTSFGAGAAMKAIEEEWADADNFTKSYLEAHYPVYSVTDHLWTRLHQSPNANIKNVTSAAIHALMHAASYGEDDPAPPAVRSLLRRTILNLVLPSPRRLTGSVAVPGNEAQEILDAGFQGLDSEEPPSAPIGFSIDQALSGETFNPARPPGHAFDLSPRAPATVEKAGTLGLIKADHIKIKRSRRDAATRDFIRQLVEDTTFLSEGKRFPKYDSPLAHNLATIHNTFTDESWITNEFAPDRRGGGERAIPAEDVIKLNEAFNNLGRIPRQQGSLRELIPTLNSQIFKAMSHLAKFVEHHELETDQRLFDHLLGSHWLNSVDFRNPYELEWQSAQQLRELMSITSPISYAVMRNVDLVRTITHEDFDQLANQPQLDAEAVQEVLERRLALIDEQERDEARVEIIDALNDALAAPAIFDAIEETFHQAEEGEPAVHQGGEVVPHPMLVDNGAQEALVRDAATLREQQERITALEDERAALINRLEKAQADLAGRGPVDNETIQQLTAQLAEKDAIIANDRAQFQDQFTAIQNQLHNISQTSEQRHQQIEQLTARNRELTEAGNAAAQRVIELTQALQESNTQLATAQGIIAERESVLGQTHQYIEDTNLAAQTHAAENRELRAELQRQQINHTAELQRQIADAKYNLALSLITNSENTAAEKMRILGEQFDLRSEQIRTALTADEQRRQENLTRFENRIQQLEREKADAEAKAEARSLQTTNLITQAILRGEDLNRQALVQQIKQEIAEAQAELIADQIITLQRSTAAKLKEATLKLEEAGAKVIEKEREFNRREQLKATAHENRLFEEERRRRAAEERYDQIHNELEASSRAKMELLQEKTALTQLKNSLEGTLAQERTAHQQALDRQKTELEARANAEQAALRQALSQQKAQLDAEVANAKAESQRHIARVEAEYSEQKRRQQLSTQAFKESIAQELASYLANIRGKEALAISEDKLKTGELKEEKARELIEKETAITTAKIQAKFDSFEHLLENEQTKSDLSLEAYRRKLDEAAEAAARKAELIERKVERVAEAQAASAEVRAGEISKRAKAQTEGIEDRENIKTRTAQSVADQRVAREMDKTNYQKQQLAKRGVIDNMRLESTRTKLQHQALAFQTKQANQVIQGDGIALVNFARPPPNRPPPPDPGDGSDGDPVEEPEEEEDETNRNVAALEDRLYQYETGGGAFVNEMAYLANESISRLERGDSAVEVMRDFTTDTVGALKSTSADLIAQLTSSFTPETMALSLLSRAALINTMSRQLKAAQRQVGELNGQIRLIASKVGNENMNELAEAFGNTLERISTDITKILVERQREGFEAFAQTSTLILGGLKGLADLVLNSRSSAGDKQRLLVELSHQFDRLNTTIVDTFNPEGQQFIELRPTIAAAKELFSPNVFGLTIDEQVKKKVDRAIAGLEKASNTLNKGVLVDQRRTLSESVVDLHRHMNEPREQQNQQLEAKVRHLHSHLDKMRDLVATVLASQNVKAGTAQPAYNPRRYWAHWWRNRYQSGSTNAAGITAPRGKNPGGLRRMVSKTSKKSPAKRKAAAPRPVRKRAHVTTRPNARKR